MELNLEKKVNNLWRFERKFPFNHLQLPLARISILSNPALFSVLYEPRWVHNIYFDSIDLKSYHENVNGVSERKKLRIRWYQKDNLPNSIPHLEYKLKKNSVGTKKTIELNSELFPFFTPTFKLNNELLIAFKNIKEFQNTEYSKPVFHNYYYREYYISNDKKFRLTLDSQLRFENLSTLIIATKQVKSDYAIIELKYNIVDDLEAMKITKQLPNRMDKFSKFVEGVKLLKIDKR